jgi:N-acetylmuramoyl-L-alanine amidase
MSVRAAAITGAILTILLGIESGAAAAAAPQALAASDFPVATDARLAGDETQTRLVIDINRKIDLRAFMLANPDRVVIDLPQVLFRFPPKTGEAGRGLIKAFRFGLMMTGGSRMVLDLARPARIEKSFVLDATEDQPARLVLDLAAADRDAFLREIAAEARVRATPPLGAKPAAPPNAAPAAGDTRPVIVLDPGHGGIDNGTKSAKGETEKAIVLEFALRLRDIIEKSGKYRVLMTRTDDTFVALADRVAFARARQAELFISIHADALPRGEGDAQGASVYTLSETASDAEAARLAETENRADVIAGIDLTAEPDDVADILIDLARRETKGFSVKLARSVIDSMRNVARMHKNSLKSAGFRVLKAPDIPSVLVELGYVSNRDDIKSLTSPEWRERTAEAMAEAINRYLSTRPPAASRASGQN